MDIQYYKHYLAIGLNIMYQRKRCAMTQEVLSEKVDISRLHLQRIETANAAPSLDTLFKLSEALNVPVTEFFKNIG